MFEAFTGGVREAGCGVADIGRCDTPAVYFATARYGFDAGVMITASHNPAEYNGLKVSGRDAVPVGYGTGLERLEAMTAALLAAAPTATPASPCAYRCTPAPLDIRADYLAHLARFREGIGSLKVVVDYSNGTGSLYFPAALDGLPCDRRADVRRARRPVPRTTRPTPSSRRTSPPSRRACSRSTPTSACASTATRTG